MPGFSMRNGPAWQPTTRTVSPGWAAAIKSCSFGAAGAEEGATEPDGSEDEGLWRWPRLRDGCVSAVAYH